MSVPARTTVAAPVVQKPAAVEPQRITVTAPAAKETVTAKPVQPEPQQQPAKTEPTDVPVISIQKIQECWTAIKAEVKKVSPQTEALLNSQKSLQIKEGGLIVGFASPMLRSKMETPDALSITHDAILKVTGASIEVKCAVVGNKSGSASTNLDIDADGIVGTALNLGGKLIHRE